MRAVFLVLGLLVAVSAHTLTPGQNEVTIQRPEGTRTFYVWIPKSYVSSSDAFGLHLSFHGLGDTCVNFGPATGFSDLSETDKFLYVYPCSEVGLLGTAWNAGTCCLQPTSVDDVGFARAIVTYMKTNYRVDSKKVWVSGFSNGAMMAEVLACLAPDVFVAAASVSGVVELEPGNDGGLAACDKGVAGFHSRASVLNVHGDADWVVPWTGDAVLGFPTVPTDFERWAKRNNCPAQPVQTFSKGTFSNQVYQGCQNNTQIEVVRNAGGGHEWPSDSNFDTTKYIMQFFIRTSQNIERDV